MYDLPHRFGRYLLLSLLGEGGMASVYLAEYRGPAGFRKRAALKVIREATIAGDEARRAARLNEARVGGLLKHPNIASCLYESYAQTSIDGTWTRSTASLVAPLVDGSVSHELVGYDNTWMAICETCEHGSAVLDRSGQVTLWLGQSAATVPSNLVRGRTVLSMASTTTTNSELCLTSPMQGCSGTVQTSQTRDTSGGAEADTEGAPWSSSHSLSWSPGCSAEPWSGIVTVEVRASAGGPVVSTQEVTYSGLSNCDGCGEVTVDGVPVGSWCGLASP